MKKIFGFILFGVACAAAGIPVGWLLRKHLCEVKFQEVTEEEQNAEIIRNGDVDLVRVNKNDIRRPDDIQAAVDGMFARPDVPNDLAKTSEKAVENELNREAGIKVVDTQKVQYFKKWHEEADAIAEKYDTRSKEAENTEDDSVDLPEDAKEFVDELECSDPNGEDEHFGDGRPPIELAGPEDWERWESKPDGAYDCIEVYWFEQEDVLSDEEGTELEPPRKFLGFDAGKMFEGFDGSEGEKLSGDPDIRYVYNHRRTAIFKINRKHTSFYSKRGMEEFGSEYDGGEDDSDEYLRSRQ